MMRQKENLETLPQEESVLWRLTELFEDVTPMRIPIVVVVPRGKGQGLEERTVIEFGTSTMIFFESRLLLELEDKLHIKNSDGSLGADAIVVALRLNDGRRAIAASFMAEVRNWIIQG